MAACGNDLYPVFVISHVKHSLPIYRGMSDEISPYLAAFLALAALSLGTPATPAIGIGRRHQKRW